MICSSKEVQKKFKKQMDEAKKQREYQIKSHCIHSGYTLFKLKILYSGLN